MPGSQQTLPRRKPRATAHQRIGADLEKKVRRDLRVGAKLPSEANLAKSYGVSTLTVREAVAGLVEKGLVERRHGSGTYVADLNALRHVGILLNIDLTEPATLGYWMPVMARAKQLLGTFGYRVRIYSLEQQTGSVTGPIAGCADLEVDLQKEHLHGVFVVGQALDRQRLGEFQKQSIPVVQANRQAAFGAAADYEDLLRHAVDSLVSKGCRRIAVLRWGLADSACRRILEQAGVPSDDDLIVDIPQPAVYGIGYDLTRRLLHAVQPRPDGLVICDEQVFPGASFALLEAGVRVPGDIRIATHANEGAQIFSPLPATALLVSPAEVAERLTGLLVRLINGERPPPQSISPSIRIEERPGGTPAAAAEFTERQTDQQFRAGERVQVRPNAT